MNEHKRTVCIRLSKTGRTRYKNLESLYKDDLLINESLLNCVGFFFPFS